ncbi:MAG: TonB-dependent receptor, partial [Bryobacterales bacterium]|nr:TonB-dependent receptor [Bryobacterales bacterium]
MRIRSGRVTRIVALVLCLSGAAWAQDYRARLQGRVTDSTQAVVVGAKVTLLNVSQGVETVRETTETGNFVFDFVDPASYTLSVEATGFRKFVQQNILVQARGDITVDTTLEVGAASQTIEVTEAPAALQFNSSSRDLTIDNKMVRELPLITRNPFKLAALDPAVVNTSGTEQSPYHHWAASEVETGGGTSRRNDILIDGTPVETGPKTSYTPSMDAVSEFTIQQNSVDAEFGHSAGGVMSIAMKSGTNAYHGTLYFLGRDPFLNALSDRTVVPQARNRVRNRVYGGTIGQPVKKNKLFNFFAYEAWNTTQPFNFSRTMPTDIQRNGDFSRAVNPANALRRIYDPLTTIFDAVRNTSTRTPFPGNVIPKARFDPLAAKIMESMWAPNNVGDDVTGRNNFQVESTRFYKYWNLSDRADWHISDKWKVFGRYSQFHTVVSEENLSGNDSQWWPYDAGSLRHGLNIAGDAVYAMSASTVLNFRSSYNAIIDQYDGGPFVTTSDSLAKLWANKWFEPYMKEVPQIMPPRFEIDQSGYFAKGNYWFQRPKSYSGHARVSNYRGSHYLKGGFELRGTAGRSSRPDPMRFYFRRGLTADTFIGANTNNVGDGWATFLLGTLDDSSYARYVPMQRSRFRYWSFYGQDDFKLTRRITLTLGLRYEYETAPYDTEDRVSRYLDLGDPVPEMKAAPPRIPADVAAMMKVPYSFTGAWHFADSSNRSMWDSPKTVFLPRIGVAVRINDKTALRAGYARFAVPAMLMAVGGIGDTMLGSLYMPGFNADTYAAPVLEGIPAAKFSDPFPRSNPLIMPVGKAYGRYTGLGGNLQWSLQDVKASLNERINISIQRELVNQIVLDATYFTNFGVNGTYNKQINMSDPSLSYTYKAALATRIANPFYNYLTPEKFSGSLRYQQFVTRGALLKPYPQYVNLTQQNTPGPRNRYQALQLRAQRPFAKGFNLLVAYNYNRDRSE